MCIGQRKKVYIYVYNSYGISQGLYNSHMAQYVLLLLRLHVLYLSIYRHVHM